MLLPQKSRECIFKALLDSFNPHAPLKKTRTHTHTHSLILYIFYKETFLEALEARIFRYLLHRYSCHPSPFLPMALVHFSTDAAARCVYIRYILYIPIYHVLSSFRKPRIDAAFPQAQERRAFCAREYNVKET